MKTFPSLSGGGAGNAAPSVVSTSGPSPVSARENHVSPGNGAASSFFEAENAASGALAHDAGAAPELIVVDSFLGALQAVELEELWPLRRAATTEALEQASAAWDALREPDPRALAQLAEQDSTELPFLAPALGRLLDELPGPKDGLSGTERRALRSIADGATTPLAAFFASQKLEAAPFLGDTWFYRALTGLGPLVETTDGAALPAPPPLSDGNVFMRRPIRLTRDGERVLSGQADRVDLVGVDRWVGGTHVTPENLWRWDGAKRKLAR